MEVCQRLGVRRSARQHACEGFFRGLLEQPFTDHFQRANFTQAAGSNQLWTSSGDDRTHGIDQIVDLMSIDGQEEGTFRIRRLSFSPMDRAKKFRICFLA